MSLAFLLRNAASRFPNKPAHYQEDRVLTYAELDAEAQRFARRLMACGAGSGDRVALHMHNGAEIAIAYFGCFLAGAIAVPINTRMKAAEIEYVLEHSGCSIYFGQYELFQEIAEIRGRLPTVRQFVIDGRGPEVGSDRLATELATTAPDQPAVILYTSGSTARPKGVVHTHRSAQRAALDFTRHLKVAETDVVAIVTPMVHYYELARRDGGEPNAGRHLPRWLRQAGFIDLRVSTSTVSYTEPTAIQAWAEAYAEAMSQSSFAEKTLEYGLATRSDLAGIAAGWRSWSRNADAFFCFSQTEVVAWNVDETHATAC
jgi:acyl-coenzyme A synthetase/AMP-(fatty) acid ligase